MGLTADGTGIGMKHPGEHPHILVTKTSLANLLESGLAEKALGILVDTKLNRSQQGDLATKVTSGTLGCTRQSIASSWKEVTLPCCSVLCPGLGSSVRNRHGREFGEDRQDSPSLLLLQEGTCAALGLLLPFLQGTSVPINLWQERAEPLGALGSQTASLLCAQQSGDSVERVREHSPGGFHPGVFALVFLAAGGTQRRRRGLPWPLAR